MLVVMVVLTALAPIIGPKKTRLPILTKNHGIAECYWDATGNIAMNLKEINSDNAKLKIVENTDYCEFEPPAGVANFTVYVIGAGGGQDALDQQDRGGVRARQDRFDHLYFRPFQGYDQRAVDP